MKKMDIILVFFLLAVSNLSMAAGVQSQVDDYVAYQNVPPTSDSD